MPAPRPPAAWASSLASTSSHVRPTISKKFSRSANHVPATEARRLFRSSERGVPAFPFARRERAHRQLLSNHHQRLFRSIEVVQLAIVRSREELVAANE